MRFTTSEMKALDILGRAGEKIGFNSTSSSISPHEAGNKIIELAKRIETERQVLIIEK
jgi:hypothetical protein